MDSKEKIDSKDDRSWVDIIDLNDQKLIVEIIKITFPDHISLEQVAETFFAIQKLCNDFILATYLRKGLHFHAPYFNFDLEDNGGNWFLSFQYRQTPIDSKILNPWKIKRELIDLIPKLEDIDPDLARICRTHIDTMLSLCFHIGKISEGLDVQKGNRHKKRGIRFHETDLVSTHENFSEQSEVDKNVSMRRRNDIMRSLYTQMGPMRMKLFDSYDGSEHGEDGKNYLRLNNEGKKYLVQMFFDIVSGYTKYGDSMSLDDVFAGEIHKTKNTYLNYMKSLQTTPEYLSSEMVVKIIEFLLNKDVGELPNLMKDSSDKELLTSYKELKKQVKIDVGHRGRFADFAINHMFLKNHYNQDLILETYEHVTSTLERKEGIQDLWTELEETYHCEIFVELRDKEIMSQMLKMQRSADISEMFDHIGGRISYIPGKDFDEETERDLHKDILKKIEAVLDGISQKLDLKGLLMSRKGDFVLNEDDERVFLSQLNQSRDDVFYAPRTLKKKSNTGGNGGYTDLKVIYTFGVNDETTPSHKDIGAEFQINRLDEHNVNERGSAHHAFLDKQKLVESFTRNKSVFHLSDYMAYVEGAVHEYWISLMNSKQRIKNIKNEYIQSTLMKKLEKDAIYTTSTNEKIKMRQFETIGPDNKKIVDRIAKDLLYAEIAARKPKVIPLLYTEDVTDDSLLEELNKDTINRETKISLPILFERDDSGALIHDMTFLTSNVNNSYETGHLPQDGYILTADFGDEGWDGESFSAKRVAYMVALKKGNIAQIKKQQQEHSDMKESEKYRFCTAIPFSKTTNLGNNNSDEIGVTLL